MALTGQLSDMSLAELIEFFCNQRKTGRLKIDYQRGHSVFFIKEGELVDAKVGALSGPEAVYYSLTLPNAAFDFSPEVLPTRRTINEPWTQVVLEGLRRLDEGLSPSDADAFVGCAHSETEMAVMMDHVERLGEQNGGKDAGQNVASSDSSNALPSFMVDGVAEAGGSRKKWMVLGAVASVVIACAVAAIPLVGGSGSLPAESGAASLAPAPPPAAPSEPAPAEAVAPPNGEAVSAPASPNPAAEAARREREERERRRRKAEDEARKEAAEAAKAAPTPAPVAAGPKSVKVSIAYDENGRVTQASVAGATPGAEAFGGTAVRIARGKRFPAGKAGTTVVTIPVN